MAYTFTKYIKQEVLNVMKIHIVFLSIVTLCRLVDCNETSAEGAVIGCMEYRALRSTIFTLSGIAMYQKARRRNLQDTERA